MFVTKLIRSLCYSFIRDVKSMLGTLALIIILYLGLFGSKKYNVEPFIKKWLSSDNSKEIVSKTIKETIFK
jgi:hypothetical protein